MQIISVDGNQVTNRLLVVEKLRSPVDKGPERVESIAGDVQTLTGAALA